MFNHCLADLYGMQQNEQDSGQFSSAAANKPLSAGSDAGRKQGRGSKTNLEFRLRKGKDPLTTTEGDIKSEQNFVQIILYPLQQLL